MRVAITGATGLIGSRLVGRLRERGAEITVLTRDPDRARSALGADVEAYAWNLTSEVAPVQALAGRDAVIHLAGENVAQRWSESAKRAIHDSRVLGTGNLIAGIEAIDTDTDDARPRTLVSSSAIGYYGAHKEEPLDEDTPVGEDFLAKVCLAWEERALEATELNLRVVLIRTGVVLDAHGGALQKMLTPFRLGVGGPLAGGEQYISWIHLDDLVGMILQALDSQDWSGPVNATAPEPVSNREFSKALGRALHRPSLLPVPALALRALYGEMAEIVTAGARVLPAKALVLGYRFAHPHLQEALEHALGSPASQETSSER